MKPYDRRMILLLVVLLLFLAVKSIWVDPVKPEDEPLKHYSDYALLVAPLQGREIPPPPWLFTYRTIQVTRLSDEGTTVILLPDPDTRLLKECSLPGEYRAKVRAYVFFVLPVKHMIIEGGVAEHGSASQN